MGTFAVWKQNRDYDAHFDDGNMLRIWDVARGLELLALPPAERATTTQQPDRTAMTLLALSPDNTRVVTGSDDHRVHLLEAAFPDPAKPSQTLAHR
jgi:WD40 repeat protein